jgi:cytochrome c-type biogenesis protein
VDAATHLGWGAALIAFGAGLASFFSPCVAPLVPGYIGYLSGTAAPLDDAPLPSATPVLSSAGGATTATVSMPAALRTRAALAPCLLFVAGFSAAFVLLGLATSSFGRLIVAYRPVLETVAGIVMLVMGAFVLGWLPRGLTLALMRERRLPSRLRLPAWLSRIGAPARGIAPFGLGVVFAAGWTPCIGPVLAAILVYAAAEANRGIGALLLAIYSLGFAIPFIAVGLGWATSLRAVGWLRRHGNVISTVTGVALLVFGVLYLTGEVTVFAVWAQRFTPPGSL